MNAAEAVTLEILLNEIKKEHPDDSYGSCVTCFQPHTDDGRQAYPCKTLQIVARIEALLRDVSQVKI